MTDTVSDIIVTGQRRAPTTGFISWPPKAPVPTKPERPHDGTVPPPWNHPCAGGPSKREWNADAAAAAAVDAFQTLSAQRNPPEDLNVREWGTALYELANGRVVRGPITSGEFTFQSPGPGGVASVTIDYSGQPANSRLIGVVHSHNAGGHLPSGSSPTVGDQAVLQYLRNGLGASANDARLYIAALTLVSAGETQYAKINFYNHVNQDAAIGGVEGPEVNPNAVPCPV